MSALSIREGTEPPGARSSSGAVGLTNWLILSRPERCDDQQTISSCAFVAAVRWLEDYFDERDRAIIKNAFADAD
jgi:hypothetical protein